MEPISASIMLGAAGLGALAGNLTEKEKERVYKEQAEKIRQANKMRQLYDFGNARYEAEMGPYQGKGELGATVSGGAAGLGLGQSLMQLGQQVDMRNKLLNNQQDANMVSNMEVPDSQSLLGMYQQPNKFGLNLFGQNKRNG
jgi:hypothetical protein